jgi:hypothetical protein
MGGWHIPYRSRPAANRQAARYAWDWFVEDEAREHKRYQYGNLGRAGCATFSHVEPPRNRTPKEMTYRHMDYWVWVMEFTNGDYEEKDALECQPRRDQPETP